MCIYSVSIHRWLIHVGFRTSYMHSLCLYVVMTINPQFVCIVQKTRPQCNHTSNPSVNDMQEISFYRTQWTQVFFRPIFNWNIKNKCSVVKSAMSNGNNAHQLDPHNIRRCMHYTKQREKRWLIRPWQQPRVLLFPSNMWAHVQTISDSHHTNTLYGG